MFWALFCENCESDRIRRTVGPSDLLKEILRLHKGGTAKQREWNDVGAQDIFIKWTDDRIFTMQPSKSTEARKKTDAADQNLVFQYLFPAAETQDDIRERMPDRFFQYYLRKRTQKSARKDDAYLLFIENISTEMRNFKLVSRTGRALERKLSGVLVENTVSDDGEKIWPGLSYDVDPERPPVGGDFVFDWSIRKTNRVQSQTRLTMVGDAEEQSIVGGLMAANVGAILKAVCLKPGEVLGSVHKDRNPAGILADHLNREIIEHNTSGSRGVDGMLMITNLTRRMLYMAEGKFHAFVFKRNAKTIDDIAQFGDMYPDGRMGMQKSFGRDIDQEFSVYQSKLSKKTIVVSFSDGVGDIIRGAQRSGHSDFKRFILDVLLGMRKKPADMTHLVNNLRVELREKLDYERLTLAQRDQNKPTMQRDDEVICVFSPLARPWLGDR